MSNRGATPRLRYARRVRGRCTHSKVRKARGHDRAKSGAASLSRSRARHHIAPQLPNLLAFPFSRHVSIL